jgi:hypothetical protein
VTGIAAANLFVAGVGASAAHVAGDGFVYTGEAIEGAFQAPEAATRQSDGFKFLILLIFHNFFLSGCFVSFDKRAKSALKFGRNLPKIGACQCQPFRVE